MNTTTTSSYNFHDTLHTTSTSTIIHATDTDDNSHHLLQQFSQELSAQKSFSTRFNLLATLFPKLLHKNLLTPHTTTTIDGYATLITRLPAYPLTTLAHPPPLACETLFKEIASALHTLSHHPYPITLTPNTILLDGSTPLITRFYDGFLAFGDSPAAPLHHRLENSAQLFQQAYLYLPTSHKTGPTSSLIYTYGTLLYFLITKKKPRGILSPLAPHPLAPLINKCLSLSYTSFEEILHDFPTPSPPPPTPKKTLPTPPPNMVLIQNPSLPPFFIDRTPVTTAQFTQFLATYHPSSHSQGPNNPATLITWHMAQEYCRWRSQQEKLSYRLPTEEEWEAAAGETVPPVIHCNAPQYTGTKPVKSSPPNSFGVYDMLGNIWEWTASPHHSHYIIKGGYWHTPHHLCTPALRSSLHPGHCQGNTGFRCVRNAE